MTTSQFPMDEYRAILRNDFTSFIERSFMELNPQAEFIPGKYIELLASKLEKCRTGETKRLIINLPPRTLKSHATSVAYPAWLLGHDPSKQIICASYGQDLADKHARDNRTVMNSGFYRSLFPVTLLSQSKNAVDDFMTTEQGFRMATSVGGVLTGRGADVIILDDVMKPDDALSETRRKATNDWYSNTLLSRLNSKKDGVIIIVMQRLHLDDLVGEVTDHETWEILSLPAIAERDENYLIENPIKNSFYTRKAGEALHPERDSVETYQDIRQTVGEYNFQSQYQQNPASRDGGLIKKEWIRYYSLAEKPHQFSWTFQSWDTASKAEEVNNFSVCTTWGVVDMNCYLIDVFRKRLIFPDLKRAVIEQYEKFHPFKVLIEEQASGIALIQALEAEFHYFVEAYKPQPGSDKYMRLSAQSLKFENGNVYLPKEEEWLDEYVRELCGFPGCKYNDQVDSTSQALDVMTNYQFSATTPRAQPPVYNPWVLWQNQHLRWRNRP